MIEPSASAAMRAELPASPRKVFALALASVNPRAGRSGNLIFVLFTFVVYNNLLNLGQNWISVGAASFGTLVLVLHGGALLLALAWLAKRHLNWTFKAAANRQRQRQLGEVAP